MSHIVPSNQVDSAGGDCTDPTTHSVRVLITGGGGGSGGGGGGALLEATFSHTYTVSGDDTFEIDVSQYNTLSVTWGAGTTNHDGSIAVYVSNDAGGAWGPWFFSSTAAEEARTQIPIFQYYRSMPAFLNVAGLDRVQFRSASFTFGTGVLVVRASTGVMWEPSQGVYLMDGRGGSIAFVTDGRLETTISTPIFVVKADGLRPHGAPITADVAITSGVILDALWGRAGCVITNLSDTETVFLAPNPSDASWPAVLNAGIPLFPHDRWEMGDHTLTYGPILAIATGPATVAIQQFDAASP